MTRKHFKEMAEQIRSMPIMSERLAAAIAFSKVAMAVNPRFDTAKFLDACEI